jgi:hypothetical protein
MAVVDCPAELAACKESDGDQPCRDALEQAAKRSAPPASGVSASVLAVIGCLQAKARERRRLSSVPKGCADEMVACRALPTCSTELAAAMGAQAPPINGSPELMATIQCLVQAGNAAREQADSKGKSTGRGRGKRQRKPTFRSTDRMSRPERAVADAEMEGRIAAEVQCDLCAAVVEDVWLRQSSAPWVRKMTPAKRGVDGGDWGAAGRTVAAACKMSSQENGAAPAFTEAYSVHPCTAQTLADGLCVERQQYHVRPASEFDVSGPTDIAHDTILAEVYAKSARKQVAIDRGVFRRVCDEVLLPAQLDNVDMTGKLMATKQRALELQAEPVKPGVLPLNVFGKQVCKAKGACDVKPDVGSGTGGKLPQKKGKHKRQKRRTTKAKDTVKRDL